MNDPSVIPRDDRRVLIAAGLFWLVYFGVLTTQSVAEGRPWTGVVSPLRDLTLLRMALVLLAVLTCFAMHRAYRSLAARAGFRPVLTMALLATITTLFLATASFALFSGYMRLVGDPSPISLLSYALHYLWVGGAWSAGYFGFVQWRAASDQAQQALRARSEAQSAQLSALRYQLNPHFLFNALNAIAGLIATRELEAAERMVERLAAFLRQSLRADAPQETSVGDELEAQKQYLEIERARFGDRLSVEIECPADLLARRVPSMILQPLIENAIKHGLSRSEEPVTIAIRVRGSGALSIVVEDNGPGVDPEKASAGLGIGLANTEARLRAHYGDRAQLLVRSSAAGFAAEIVLMDGGR